MTSLSEALDRRAEITIAPYRPDGTARAALPIWSVVVDGHPVIRSYKGADGSWYRHVLRSRRAHIRAARDEYDVLLVDADPRMRDAIDTEYRRKYASSPRSIVDQMVSDAAADTTLFVIPDTDQP